MTFRTRALLILATATLAVLCGCKPAATPPPAPVNADIRRDATVVAIESTMPSVVSIATSVTNEYRNWYEDWVARSFGKRAPTFKKEELTGIGSGVIIDERGYLITCFHVVSNALNTTRYQVKLSNGEQYDARRIARSPQKDVALLQIIAPPDKKFKPMRFSTDDDLLLGESVIAVGNPFGLGGSVTRGILSSKNRRADSGNDTLDVPDWLQTDADINPGSSGGPLINLRGDLIGLNVRVGEGQGIGFAIPARQVSLALSEFFTPEAMNNTWFGARVGSFNAPLTIISVQPRSPAERAGLQVGQRILKVNGDAPRNLIDFHRFLTSHNDLSASIEVAASGSPKTHTVQMIDFHDLIQQRLGMDLRSVKDEDVNSLRIARNAGAIVNSVEKDGPAEKAQLRPGFVITGLDDRRINSPELIADALSTKETGDHMKVLVYVPPTFGASAGEYTTTITVR